MALRKKMTSVILTVIVLFYAIVVVGCVRSPDGPNRRKAMLSNHKDKLTQFSNAVRQFKDDTGAYPDSLAELEITDEKQLKNKILPPYAFHGPYFKFPGGGIGGGQFRGIFMLMF